MVLHCVHVVLFNLGRYRGEIQGSALRLRLIIVRKNPAHIYVVVFDSFGNFARIQDLRTAGAQLWLHSHHGLDEAFQVLSVSFGGFIEGALTHPLI